MSTRSRVFPTKDAQRLKQVVWDAIKPKSPGMGNPPAHPWEILTEEGVAVVITSALLQALEPVAADFYKSGEFVRFAPDMDEAAHRFLFAIGGEGGSDDGA